eukprot:TRINITY_DN65593_c1_g1_i2.p1 TRINITY_DN65593_c1_g1~~TRINITY_DN65593_c1_g1_i2.p1  ORF type:complete len:117 (+),score=8.24 TRINITY_DN65593_c1_g1_i2:134-484(+)
MPILWDISENAGLTDDEVRDRELCIRLLKDPPLSMTQSDKRALYAFLQSCSWKEANFYGKYSDLDPDKNTRCSCVLMMSIVWINIGQWFYMAIFFAIYGVRLLMAFISLRVLCLAP